MENGSSSLWLLAVLGGPIVLGMAYFYGIRQWRHRKRELDPVREEVTRRNYEQEDRASEETRGGEEASRK